MYLSKENQLINQIELPQSVHVEVREGRIGKSLFWVGPKIETGHRLVPFTGKVVSFEEIPEERIRYVARYSRSHFIIPNGIAMYANHSCDPNCLINDEFFIETIKPLRPGAEITISYDQVSLEDYKAWGDDWDQRWSFPCACGSLKCVGQVNSYRILNFESNQKQIS